MFKKHKSEIIYFILLSILNFTVTFFAFNSIPKNIAYDEILLGKLALSLGEKPYTIFTSFADGHATPYFYLMLFSFKIFGINNFALRLPAALSGFMSVFIFYGIAKMIFKDKKIIIFPIALTLSILFTCLRWRVNFIRFSFEMPFLLLIELASVYFLIRYFEKTKIQLLIFSGLCAGMAFHSYQPGRIFFLAPLLYLIYKRINIKHLLSYCFSFLIIALPLMVFLFMNPGSDGRVNDLNYLQNSSITISQKANYLTTNIMKSTSMFIYKGDSNGRHNFPYKPALNPLIGILFIGGLVVTLWNMKHKSSHYLFFVFYFIISLIPALLTIPSENPHMLRTYTTIPSVVILIGGLYGIFKTTTLSRVISVLVTLILFVGCLYDIRTYFIYQSRVMRNSFEVTCPVQKVIYRNTKTLGDLPIECRIQKNLF